MVRDGVGKSDGPLYKFYSRFEKSRGFTTDACTWSWDQGWDWTLGLRGVSTRESSRSVRLNNSGHKVPFICLRDGSESPSVEYSRNGPLETCQWSFLPRIKIMREIGHEGIYMETPYENPTWKPYIMVAIGEQLYHTAKTKETTTYSDNNFQRQSSFYHKTESCTGYVYLYSESHIDNQCGKKNTTNFHH